MHDRADTNPMTEPACIARARPPASRP